MNGKHRIKKVREADSMRFRNKPEHRAIAVETPGSSLINNLEPRLVVGITGGVLDGLVEAGRDPAEVLGPVPAVVTADDDAHTRLREAGLNPRRSVRLGPTTAIEGLDADGPVYDATRWDVEEVDAELLVSNLVPRLTEARRLRTGVRGRVVGKGRVSVSGSG